MMCLHRIDRPEHDCIDCVRRWLGKVDGQRLAAEGRLSEAEKDLAIQRKHLSELRLEISELQNKQAGVTTAAMLSRDKWRAIAKMLAGEVRHAKVKHKVDCWAMTEALEDFDALDKVDG